MAKKPEALFSDQFRAALKKLRGVIGFRIESSHTAPGFPDWILFSFASVKLVELKVKGGTRTTAQKVLHSQLASLKIPVYLLTRNTNSVTLNSTEFNSLDEALRAIIEGE